MSRHGGRREGRERRDLFVPLAPAVARVEAAEVSEVEVTTTVTVTTET